jgi:hypothetical protein
MRALLRSNSYRYVLVCDMHCAGAGVGQNEQRQMARRKNKAWDCGGCAELFAQTAAKCRGYRQQPWRMHLIGDRSVCKHCTYMYHVWAV